MSLKFRSIKSSSQGNCLAVFTDTTKVLFDIGLASMKKTRNALAEIAPDISDINGVVVSHTHSDHVSYYPLRVLSEAGIPINIHHRCVDQLKQKHLVRPGLGHLCINTFGDEPFDIGDLTINPFEVAHNPRFPTYGFTITHQDKKIVIATDLNSYDGIFDYFLDADMIFIESNHDLELLRQFYNPNSAYHLPNPSTAQLLEKVCAKSSRGPKVVVLGHISPQRNTPKIAIEEICTHFKRNKKKMEFDLIAAPLTSPGATITV